MFRKKDKIRKPTGGNRFENVYPR